MTDKIDYGEPWEVQLVGVEGKEQNAVVVPARGGLLTPYGFYEKDRAGRMAACVNALEGCPDPEAFVHQVTELMEAIGLRKDMDRIEVRDHPSLNWLRKKS